MTDEELMLRYAQDDDPKAFDELYQRYASMVYSYLKKNCFDPKDAEEIHQNVFLKLHNGRRSYDSKYPFSAWLFTMVKSIMIDDFRKIKSRRKTLELVSQEEHTETEREILNLPDQLDDSQKKLLELRYLEEWTFEEIGKELKLNAATVRKRISRLLRELRGGA